MLLRIISMFCKTNCIKAPSKHCCLDPVSTSLVNGCRRCLLIRRQISAMPHVTKVSFLQTWRQQSCDLGSVEETNAQRRWRQLFSANVQSALSITSRRTGRREPTQSSYWISESLAQPSISLQRTSFNRNCCYSNLSSTTRLPERSTTAVSAPWRWSTSVPLQVRRK